MEPPTQIFRVGEHRLAYDVRGSGDHAVVLVPGLLMPRRMHMRLADALADSGFRIITMDPLGFGESDRPAGYWHYSMPIFGLHIVALLDELGLDKAVLYGTSAGANMALATAALAPERLCGMVVESPVLERALPFCGMLAVPGLALVTLGAPLVRVVGRAAQRIPRTRASVPDLVLTWIAQEPRVIADVLQGIIYGGIMVGRPERRTIRVKTLVIGHRFDPVHPIADDHALTAEVGGRFLQSRSIIELRRAPERLAPAIAGFIRDCWGTTASAEEPAVQAVSKSL